MVNGVIYVVIQKDCVLMTNVKNVIEIHLCIMKKVNIGTIN